MRERTFRVVVGLLSLVAGAWVASAGVRPAHATLPAPVANVDVGLVNCLPFNLVDGGSGGQAIGCQDGGAYQAVLVQNNELNAVWIGGGKNFTATNRTRGQKHCDGCPGGPDMPLEVRQGRFRCIGGVADAGAIISVLCGQP